MNIRVREFELGANGLKAAPEVSGAILAAINQYALEAVESDAVIARQMLLCHDQYDRSGERFPKAYLDQFAVTLPGKAVLPGHDYRALPLGKFHSAGVVSQMEEFPVLAGSPNVKAAEMVANTDAKRRKVTYLDAGFYYPNDEASAPLDNRIKTGVYRSVSVGFKFDDINCDVCKKSYFSDCPHYGMQEYEPGKIVTLTYSGDATKAEALEGSIVYLGCQPNARMSKGLAAAIQSGEPIDVRALSLTAYGEDLVALKAAEALARTYGHKTNSWAFPALKVSPSGGGETQPDAGKETSMDLIARARKLFGLADTATEDEVAGAMEKSAADGKSATENAAKLATAETALKTAEAKAQDLAPLAEAGKAAVTDLQKSIADDDFRLTGKEANPELSGLVEMYVKSHDYAKLKALADAKLAARLEKFGGKGLSGDPSETGEPDDEPKKISAAEIRERVGR